MSSCLALRRVDNFNLSLFECGLSQTFKMTEGLQSEIDIIYCVNVVLIFCGSHRPCYPFDINICFE